MADAARLDAALEVLAGMTGATAPIDPAMRLTELGVDSLAFVEIATALRGAGFAVREDAVDGDTTVAEVLVESSGSSADLPPGNGWFRGPARAVGGSALRWWFDLRVTGVEHVPVRGAAILAMNHESALDIPLSVVACPRPITFMAKRELFKNGFVSYWLNALGGFRVDRDRFDLVAVDRALTILRSGGVLGMYPEGTRSPGTLLRFLPGAAWLALRTGAPIVPCVLSGTELAAAARRPRAARVRITFLPSIAAAALADPGERLARASEVTADLRRVLELELARPGAGGAG